MKSQSNNSFPWFIWIDMLLNTAALIGTAIIIYITNQSLSFGGFMSLFLLLLLAPYFLTTSIILILLLLSIKKNRSKLHTAAFILQIAAPILWLLIMYALDSGGSWFEAIMLFQIIGGITGFLLRVSREKENE